MKELIDKSALIAEIKRRISNHNKELKHASDEDFVSSWASDEENQKLALIALIPFINTLETKEVDLENLFQALPEKIADEKSHQVYELSIYHYDGQCVVDYVGEIDHDSLHAFSGNTLYEAIEEAWNWLRKNSTGG